MRASSSFGRVAAAATIVALLTACSAGTDASSTGPQGGLTSEQTQEIATSLAGEVQTSIGIMTVGSAASAPGASGSRLMLPAPRLRTSMVHMATSACPTYSQYPFVDSDGDGVPDDVIISFPAGACVVYDTTTHETLTLTGAIAVADPTPTVAGPELLGHADSVTLDLYDQADQLVAEAQRSGDWSVSVSGGGLKEAYDLTTTLVAAGQPTVSALSEWTATYTPNLGTEFTEAGALPPGTLQGSGAFGISDETQEFEMTLDTPTPLQYDPVTCSGGVTPFTAGELHATVTGTGPVGYVRIVWSDCAAPTATFVGG